MTLQTLTSLSTSIQSYLEAGDLSKLEEALKGLLPTQIADVIDGFSTNQRYTIFTLLPIPLAASAFELLPISIQKELISSLPSDKAASLLNALSPDDRVAFLEELSSPVVNKLIKLLSNEERVLTLKLLGYPEYSVGRLMTPDYIAIKMNWTVSEVLEYVRKYGRNSETINILYVVDDRGYLLDDIKIREFLFASPEKKVADLADHKFVALFVNDDEETAINVFRKYDRVALPVVDKQGILLGIVTIDDVLHLAKEEDTEDMQKIGGMEALEGPYMQTPFFVLMKKRAGWLVILFLGEMLTATAMGYFQDEITKAVVLTMFLPLIMSSGGNSGSQAATLIICAMTLGEVTVRDWWRIMKREVLSGLFLGTILGSIAFLRISLWSMISPIYGVHWPLLALTVFLSLIGVVLWGTLSGSMLPILLKWCGADPATSSAPFIATLIDVTGIVIYFLIALFVLQGTLL